MALIKCADCGREVSDRAPACPQCGCPTHDGAPAVVAQPRPAQSPGAAAPSSSAARNPPPRPTARTAPSAGSHAGGEQQWWLSRSDKAEGPFPASSIIAGLRNGSIAPAALACPVGSQQWQRLIDWPPFASVCPGTVAPPPALSNLASTPHIEAGRSRGGRAIVQSPRMNARYNQLSFAFGVPGIIIQSIGMFGGQVLVANSSSPETFGPLMGLIGIVGTALLLTGLAYYAKAKGRHPLWCLFGLLSWIGLIVLACLENLNSRET